MTGIIYAFLSALFTSVKSVLGKQSLKNLDEYTVSWFIRFLSAVFILPLFFFLPFPEIGKDFWWVVILNGVLGSIATVIFSKALMESDLSLTAPISSFDSIILIGTSYLILGEVPSLIGLSGVVLIFLGAYFLNISERKNGRMAPIKKLFSDKGAKMMFAAVIIWSITSSFDKIGIRNSSAVFWALAMSVIMAIMLSPFVYKNLVKKRKEIVRERNGLIGIGIISMLVVVTGMVAIDKSLVVYAISIKKASILISIIFGGVIFKEKNIRERLLGGAIMIIGIILITVS